MSSKEITKSPQHPKAVRLTATQLKALTSKQPSTLMDAVMKISKEIKLKR